MHLSISSHHGMIWHNSTSITSGSINVWGYAISVEKNKILKDVNVFLFANVFFLFAHWYYLIKCSERL